MCSRGEPGQTAASLLLCCYRAHSRQDGFRPLSRPYAVPSARALRPPQSASGTRECSQLRRSACVTVARAARGGCGRAQGVWAFTVTEPVLPASTS